MRSLIGKIVLLSLLPAIVAGFIAYNNFFYYRRGWHSAGIQYQLIFWLVRLLLAPLLVFFVLKCKKTFSRISSLLIVQAGGLAAYVLVHGLISFIVCRLPVTSFDGRNTNLVNIIRTEAFSMNVLVYVISVFILYAWFFIEQKEMFHQEMGSMKASLAAFQSKLQKRHESGAAGIADKIFNFAVKKGHQTIFISFEEIICVMSKGPYVQLVTDSGAHLLYSRLYEVQQKLPETFIRIHRSHIVNTGFIKGIRSLLNGDQQVLLKNGMEVRASRTYKERLRNFSS